MREFAVERRDGAQGESSSSYMQREDETRLPRIIHGKSYSLSEESFLMRPFGYIQGFWEIVSHKELSAGQKFSECIDGVGVVLDAPRRYKHLLLAGSEFGAAPFLISGIWKTLFACASSLVDLKEVEDDCVKQLNSKLKTNEEYSQELLKVGGSFLRNVYMNLLEIREQKASEVDLEDNRIESSVLARCVVFADSLSRSESALVSQVGSRGMYLVSAVVVVIARAFFAVVGAFSAALSFFWPHAKLVRVAYEGMGVLLIVRDVCYCTLKFISPKSSIRQSGWETQYIDPRESYNKVEQQASLEKGYDSEE